MPNELPPDDPRSVWQCQSVEHTAMPLAEIRRRARNYQRKMRFRNGLEYLAVAFIAVFFVHTVRTVHYRLIQAGADLCFAGGLYMAWQLNRRGSARAMPSSICSTTVVGFHRAQLVRQRDLALASWSWYLGPLLPGMAVIGIGAGLANPRHLHYAWAIVGGYFALIAVAFRMVRRYHLRCARRLQTEIDELDAWEKQQ
jgi:hypothetical protein